MFKCRLARMRQPPRRAAKRCANRAGQWQHPWTSPQVRHGLSFSLCLMALLFWIAEPLYAQVTFIEDNGPARPLGPKAATGAIVWSHGRSLTDEDSKSPTPGYIETFRLQGWNAFRFNRRRDDDSLRGGAHALAWFAAILKARGYRTVVLAGQSYGSFMSLMAADISNDVDAVIAIAPAAFGPVKQNAKMGTLNASRLYPLLEHVRRARVMLFYFQDDIYDPGGRGSRSEQILSARPQAHLVIDQPIGLETHWAGSTREFAARFGPCIADFATYGNGAGAVCEAAARGLRGFVNSTATLRRPAPKSIATAPLSGGSAPPSRDGVSQGMDR